MTNTTNTLPRISTATLLEMKDGDTMDLGEGRSIRCVDDYRRTFEYRDGDGEYDERVSLAYDDVANEWVSAQWSDRSNQYTSGDLRAEYDAVYAYARRLNDLHGVRTYKSAGVLIRRVMERQTSY